jgi:NAD(P)-dependent dehydrogenase (short-subunit alcohol dehydrogenase family)
MLVGKTCLVTGATHGIGLATARALAALGARVLIHGRDPTLGKRAVADIGRSTRNWDVSFVRADFSSLAEVRNLAAEIDSTVPKLDVLVNNAGLMSASRAWTADGYEITFAVNHLAPFLLTNLLLDKLKRSAPARIVIVASEAHRRVKLDFDDLMNVRTPSAMRAYGRSKLANLLFARELADRLRGTGVTVNALHPGVVNTHLFNNSSALVRVAAATLGKWFLISPQEGAKTSVYLASSPEVAGKTGGYYRRCKPASPSRAAQNDADAHRLWEISARLVDLPAPSKARILA